MFGRSSSPAGTCCRGKDETVNCTRMRPGGENLCLSPQPCCLLLSWLPAGGGVSETGSWPSLLQQLLPHRPTDQCGLLPTPVSALIPTGKGPLTQHTRSDLGLDQASTRWLPSNGSCPHKTIVGLRILKLQCPVRLCPTVLKSPGTFLPSRHGDRTLELPVLWGKD